MKSHDKKLTIAQKITFMITFILLFSFAFTTPLTRWIWGVKSENYIEIPLWFKYCFFFFEYILVSAAIWLNGNNLGKLNIDKPFMVIFIFTGTLISFYYLPATLGAITFLVTWMMFRRLTKNNFTFNADVNYSRAMAIFMPGILLIVLFHLVLIFFFGWALVYKSIWTILYYTDLPSVVFQEITFRGLIWICLGYLGLNDNKIFYIQGLLFWFVHTNYLSKPIMFWITLPLASLWFSSLVWRSKSITFSTTVHFLLNFTAVMLGG